jgi:hypothetical protein
VSFRGAGPAQQALQHGPGGGERVKFRKYWDAELRASVYLNEFLTENANGWTR